MTIPESHVMLGNAWLKKRNLFSLIFLNDLLPNLTQVVYIGLLLLLQFDQPNSTFTFH